MALRNERKILESKIQIPDVRQTFQRREKLLEELEQEKPEFMVFHATIGYGKTVLMSQYVKLPGRICAWYHLDALDNDMSIFLTYLTESLKRAMEGFVFDVEPYLEQETSSRLIRDLVLEITDYLNGFPDQKLILALDDFQVLANPEIFHMLEELLEHMPDHFQLMVATKSVVPEVFTKYLMQGRGRVLNYEKLLFSEQEVHEVLGRMLSEKDAEIYTGMIWRNMEGWPAGVMFAILYLRQLGMRTAEADWEHIIQGSLVQNYIAYELFKRLPYEIQNFLLKTSFAEELSPELCNEICGISNAGAILKYLLQEDMFITHVCR